jgi:hypothetical protein
MLSFQASGGGEVMEHLASFPCHYCGIILPVELIQIEHQMPQNGADGAAVLKALHSLNAGLTAEPAHGVKNMQAVRVAKSKTLSNAGTWAPRIAAVTAGNVCPVPVKGHLFGLHEWFARPRILEKLNRYTLTQRGKTFLTIAIMYRQNFVQECKNSILNLVPACASCNRGKSNMVHATKSVLPV